MTKIPVTNTLLPLKTTTAELSLKTSPTAIFPRHVDAFVTEEKLGSLHKKAGPVLKSCAPRTLSELERRYYQEALKYDPPHPSEPLISKTPTQAFNHTHEYVIKDGFLWYRSIGESRFKPLFYDGYPDALPVSVHADGANLFIVDEHHEHHYKKVLEEFRPEEVDVAHRQEMEQQGIDVQDCAYIAFDINEINNWQKEWFSLPVASSIINIFHKGRLIIPESARAVAISHRGRYNNHVDDNVGQHHPVGTGVTTAYVLDENGQDIHKLDPWATPWAKTTLGLKETHTTSFVANNMDVSASTIMAIGFEIDHSTKKNTLKIMTRLADIDTEGGNPGLKYSFTYDPEQKDTRILPFDSDWREHPITITKQAMVSKTITIVQTGEGNHARQLRVDGLNEDGVWGQYRKMLLDKDWKFVPQRRPEIIPPALMPITDTVMYSSVHDYQGVFKSHPIELRNFGKRSNHAQIIVTIDERAYTLDLYKRVGFATFLGFESYKYDLVIKDNALALKEIFGEDKAIEVKVKESKGMVKIRSTGITLHPFKLKFEPI